MIWIYIAIFLIILFFLFGYIREIYTPKFTPSKEIIKKVDEILKNPINVAIDLLKKEVKIARISEKNYIYLHLAFLYMEIGKFEKALRLSRSLIVGAYIDESIRNRAIILVGEIYLKLNRIKEGLEFLLEHKINDKNYYFLIAKFYEQLKDYKNSAYYYKKIIHNLEKEQKFLDLCNFLFYYKKTQNR
jgi:tetratricopeptide (TPR) repeat protein